MSSKTTPGPWSWCDQEVIQPNGSSERRRFFHEIVADGVLIASVDGEIEGERGWPSAEVMDRATNTANARLIAAAPDLYSEAVKVVEWLDRLANRADELAKDRRFPCLADANAADAKNYRASARGLKEAIAKAQGK